MVTPAKQQSIAQPVALASMHKGDCGIVRQVLQQDPEVFGDETRASIGRRLVEIGFVPGERVHIVEEVWPGGDPMAVRVGSTVFALRRREAQAVLVALDVP